MRTESGTRKHRAFRALAAMGIAAVLWLTIYSLGISDARTYHHTPSAVYSKYTVTNGVQVNIVVITDYEVPWNDVTVRLTDDTNFAEWSPRTRDLDDGSWASVNLTSTGATALGDIDVYCWAFDRVGDGYVSGKDYIQVFTEAGATGLSTETTYRLVLIFEPTGGEIGAGITFTGQS
ncbi:MAG: hypothetical protein OEM29_01065 [Thermoplasmata archaeon]|nr:hypothetical protein [Thermoplasmata archaeon]